MILDVSTSIVIRRPRLEVATYAARPDNAPRWHVYIEAVDWLSIPPLCEGSRIAFTARVLGRRLRYVYEVEVYAPGEQLVMRTVDGPFPMARTYAWEDTSDGHTRMTLRDRGAPAGLLRLGLPAMGVALRFVDRDDLVRLKRILEEAVRTERFEGKTQAAPAA